MTKSLIEAVSDGEVHIVEMTRIEARAFMHDKHSDETDTDLLEAFDAAQGEADAVGTNAYVVIRITGGPL